MKKRMKILIAYDGSECADAALDDLNRAGLPEKASAVVLSVVENWLPPPSALEVVEGAERRMETRALAWRAAVHLRSSMPGWDVEPEVGFGSPATVIVGKADTWKPELIVVGSHGRTALGRFFFGSVSQKVLHEACCSVRIARGRLEEPGTPVRILIGVDGSPGAEAAVGAVISRHWPRGSEARIVNAAGIIPPAAPDLAVAQVAEWVGGENARMRVMAEAAEEKLKALGLATSVVVKEGDPKRLLTSEAESWGADCIFVGARGVGAFERFLIGSVSSTVAARAHCSVEVIREVKSAEFIPG